jgi:Na+-driven multidrug efflux pump
VVLQLWSFLALVLDSLAIAAQALVGAALGAGDVALATARPGE